MRRCRNQINDDDLKIIIAVAGYKKEDISLVLDKNVLTVKSDAVPKSENVVLHRGISGRAWSLAFDLSEFIQISDVTLENGLLEINLHNEIPEAKKPRVIAIK